MCGIVGAVSAAASIDRDALQEMRDTLRHRGPDDRGIWLSSDSEVGLAHCRLSILDLSERGHQPMATPGGELCITYNGEIYNHAELRRELQAGGAVFRSGTDTEVILEAYRTWGPSCVERLNGMFAFGLYDRGRRSLFLARDRAGEKPLYYWQGGGLFLFASELKAIVRAPQVQRRIDRLSLEHYLAYGYVPGDRCILQGAHKLPPAHVLIYDLGRERVQLRRYWALPEPQPASAADRETLATELESLLADSVRLRLMADVPVGVLLSGGVDSSLLTALAARAPAGVMRTFTLSLPDYPDQDETRYARRVARHFGTEHAELVAEPASVELLPLLARQFDEPLADQSIVPTYMVCRLVGQHVKVAVGGDGGDELFGGYPHYSHMLLQEHARRWIPGAVRGALAHLAQRSLPLGARGRNHLLGFGGDTSRGIAHINMYFDARTRARLLRPASDAPSEPDAPERYRMSLCTPGTQHPAAGDACGFPEHPAGRLSGEGGPRQHGLLGGAACAVSRSPGG